jgi:CBS domain containing-hemolysin-like protein
VEAQIELHELERAVGAGGLATKHPFMTLAGLLLESLKRIPLVGEVMVVNGWRLEIMEVENNRIERVLVSRLPDTFRVLDAHAAGRESADELV